MRVTIFGVGYVGLVQAAALAESGHEVLCVDIDAKRVEDLKGGIIPIFEPGLEDLVRQNTAEGRLDFTTDVKVAVDYATIQMIAVGTPPDEDGSADTRHVLAVAQTIGRHMEDDRIVVTKSTVPVGTSDAVANALLSALAERGAGSLSASVVSNPEFLREGSAVGDCLKPDRIVIGSTDEKAIATLRELYAPFNRNHEKMIVMDVRSAELTKYAANCMLATRISFMNEIANLAELLNADVQKVRLGIGSDPRIGYDFLYAGVGYGGSCFPKDVSALIRIAEGVAYEPKLLNAVEARNTAQKGVLFEKIRRRFGDDLKGRTFALWGLAFKARTDDMREASSRTLMEKLWEAGATVQAFDPEAMGQAQEIYGQRDDLLLCGTKESALRGADALLIVTEWKNFLAPSFDLIRKTLNSPVIFDGRNLYEPATVERYGLEYHSIGRASGGGSQSVRETRLDERVRVVKAVH